MSNNELQMMPLNPPPYSIIAQPQWNWAVTQPGENGPVTTQPLGVPLTYSPGLHYLTQIDQLLVHQKIEVLEVLTGFETKNQYVVKNSLGQQVFQAKEESDCCDRMCCGSIRPLEMTIYDNFQHEVIHLSRPLACQGCCFPCCLQTMEVSSPPGNLIGKIEEEWTLWYSNFRITDATGNTLLRIKGPLFNGICCGFNKVEFEIFTKDEVEQLGVIEKQWGGCCREGCTDADNFVITFPIDFDVKIKALLLGACFLIDFMCYENKNSNDSSLLGVLV